MNDSTYLALGEINLATELPGTKIGGKLIHWWKKQQQPKQKKTLSVRALSNSTRIYPFEIRS